MFQIISGNTVMLKLEIKDYLTIILQVKVINEINIAQNLRFLD